jgi:hypothetical protein
MGKNPPTHITKSPIKNSLCSSQGPTGEQDLNAHPSKANGQMDQEWDIKK